MKTGIHRLLIVAFFAFAVTLPGSARSEEIMRIAAVVNDDVISMRDFLARIKMVTVMSRLPDSVEVRQRLAPQVLRSLIDEKLKVQEAKRLGLPVTEDEILAALGRLEAANKMPVGGLSQYLKEQGIDLPTLSQQIAASIAWNKVINQRIRPTVRISAEEVQDSLNEMRGRQDQARYLVSEIFLGVESPDDEDSVRQLAERLVQQIGAGASFENLARQFSNAATATVGGDTGWIQKGESEPEIDAMLSTMKAGQLRGPIRTITGYHILALRDVEIAKQFKAEDITVSIAQVLLPFPKGAKAEDIANQKELARTVSETAAGCEDMDKLGNEISASGAAMLEDVKIGDLAADLRPLAASLEIGKASAPVDLKTGVAVIMVCKREDPSNLPKPHEIRERIGAQRLNIQTRRYLRDLRRAAFLDVRV